MKKETKKEENQEPFDLKKWMERESANDKIMPNDYFPDSSNHPFFKRKREEAIKFAAKHPHR
ncbi:hypothetical protein [Chitinophaga deserti]|uniref:hypothetical protein n=1 Tax=Chitinophaga deserti TaxID=2164099 RepID=UPI000D6C873A|nr:hypothetical protein [Chitinophaga deserti]